MFEGSRKVCARRIFERLSIRKSYFPIYLIALLSVLLLFLLDQKIYIYLLFILLGLGWSLFFFGKELNLIEHLMVSPVISFCLFIAFITFFVFLGIKMTVLLGILFVLCSLVVIFYSNVFKVGNIRVNFQKADILLVSMIAVALISKVLSVRGMHTPNLSDEITHSYIAKLIVDTGQLSYFYSPGLHILAAYSTMMGGESVVKQILYLTNFFSAYSGTLVYLYIKHIFDDEIVGLVSALMFSFGAVLSNLFYYSGKNAFIAAVPVLIFFIFLVSKKEEEYSSKRLILSGISLFAIFIIHYPTAVFACIFWFCSFLMNFKKGKKDLLLVLPGALLGFLLMFFLMRKQLILHPEQASIIDSSNTNYFVVPESLVLDVLAYIKSILEKIRMDIFIGSKSLFYLSFAGVAAFLWDMFKATKKENHISFLIWVLGSYILVAIIHIFSIYPIRIVEETYLILHFVPWYIFLAFFVAFVYKLFSKIFSPSVLFFLFTICYVGIFTFEGGKIYDRIQEKKAYNIVKDADMRMFEWIDENIPDDKGILINGYNVIPGLVLPSDSGGWITVMSDNPITFPFWEFSNQRTFSNYNYYLELSKNLEDCNSREYFLNNGFQYYFQGTIPLGGILATPSELELGSWEMVHSEENVYLFKIPSCKVGH